MNFLFYFLFFFLFERREKGKMESLKRRGEEGKVNGANIQRIFTFSFFLIFFLIQEVPFLCSIFHTYKKGK